MTVDKIATWIPATDEMMLDAGYDGPMATLMRERLTARAAESDRIWRALPWYVRLHRTLHFWTWMIPWRIREWIHRDCE